MFNGLYSTFWKTHERRDIKVLSSSFSLYSSLSHPSVIFAFSLWWSIFLLVLVISVCMVMPYSSSSISYWWTCVLVYDVSIVCLVFMYGDGGVIDGGGPGFRVHWCHSQFRFTPIMLVFSRLLCFVSQFIDVILSSSACNCSTVTNMIPFLNLVSECSCRVHL